MSKPFRGTIHHWARRPMDSGGFYIIGHVQLEDDEDRIGQGFIPGGQGPIRTSEVIKFSEGEIETRNSIYKLGEMYGG